MSYKSSSQSFTHQCTRCIQVKKKDSVFMVRSPFKCSPSLLYWVLGSNHNLMMHVFLFLSQAFWTGADAGLAPDCCGKSPVSQHKNAITLFFLISCIVKVKLRNSASTLDQPVVSEANTGPGCAPQKAGGDPFLHVTSELWHHEHPSVPAAEHQ